MENTEKNSNLNNSSGDVVDLPPITTKSTLGLLNVRALIFLILWYIFSGCTLFLNKYILTYMNGNPTILGK